jgi:hypothetical protein
MKDAIDAARDTAMNPALGAPYGGKTMEEAMKDYDRRVVGAMGELAKELMTRPLRTEDITAEMLDASPFLLRNMVEENGKTIKQNNMDRKHTIPFDTLVELENGVRMFVVLHTRDCDGTPMYGLADYKQDEYINGNGQISTGHIEDSMVVVKRPTKLPTVTLQRYDSADAIVAKHWGISVDDIEGAVCTVAPRMEDDRSVVMERDVPLSDWLRDVRAMGIWGFADMPNSTIHYWVNTAKLPTMSDAVEFFAHELYHLSYHAEYRHDDPDVELRCEVEAGMAGDIAAEAYKLTMSTVFKDLLKGL